MQLVAIDHGWSKGLEIPDINGQLAKFRNGMADRFTNIDQNKSSDHEHRESSNTAASGCVFRVFLVIHEAATATDGTGVNQSNS